jgi:HAD superfamily hydrolase (TIGR01509 family)
MIRALLFDLDGTLVDTEHQHYQAFEVTFGRLGIPFDQGIYDSRILGGATVTIADEFLPHLPADERMQVMDDKEALYRELLADLVPLPGVVAAGILDRFEAIISAVELADAKPHPLPYLTGIQALGASPESTIAFEDSRAGMCSAVAAGLSVVGITSVLPAAELLALGASIAVADYHDPRIMGLLERRLPAAGVGARADAPRDFSVPFD